MLGSRIELERLGDHHLHLSPFVGCGRVDAFLPDDQIAIEDVGIDIDHVLFDQTQTTNPFRFTCYCRGTKQECTLNKVSLLLV